MRHDLSAASNASEIDLTERALYKGGIPHDLFTELRSIGAVVRHPAVYVPGVDDFGFWSVVRHHEAQQANRDWETFTAVDGPGIAPQPIFRDAEMIVAFDPPEHTRIRRLLSAGFTPRMVARLEADIERRSEKILDEVMARGDDVVDFVSEIAHELPMHVIADIVGIPDSDRPWIFEQTDVCCVRSTPTPDLDEETSMAAQLGLFEYAQQLSEEKRAHPTDDIWTQLTLAEVVDDDGHATRLTGHQLDAFFMILSVAGSETTRNAHQPGHPGPRRRARAVPVPAQRTGPRRSRGRRGAALVIARADVHPDRDPRRRARRRARSRRAIGSSSGIRPRTATTDVFADPFRFDVSRHPEPARGFRRWRSALLPRSESGQEGDPGDARRPRPPVRPDRGRRGPRMDRRSARSTTSASRSCDLPVRLVPN